LNVVGKSLKPWPPVQRPQLPLDALELAGRNSAPNIKVGINSIPYQSSPTPLLCNVTRTCCKECLQCGHTREEVFDLVSDGEGFLQMG
jgi:hypothetical protein